VSGVPRPLPAAFVLALAAASCRPTPARPDVGLSEPGVAEAIEFLMGDDVRAARQLGASAPALALTGTGLSGDSLGGFAEIPRGECALILARGTRAVQDIDAFAFDDDGTVIASDEAPAKDASLLVCPPRASRVFASTRLAAGFGMFGLTLQTVAPRQTSLLAQRFGLTSGRSLEVSELTSNWPGLDERLTEHRRRLGGEWETLRKVALPLDPRAYVNVSATVDANTCLDLYITPSDDVAHLDLEVLEASGRWIGSGEARGTDRDLLVCSSESRDVVIRSRPHAGQGLAALVVSSSNSAEIEGSAARYDLRPEGDIAALRQAKAQRLQARGYPPASSFQEGLLQAERRVSVPLPLASGCSRVDVLTAAPLRSLRAWLWDEHGQLLAEDLGGMDAVLFTCGSGQGARLDLDTPSRGGAYAVEVRHGSSLPRAAQASPLALGRLLSALDARGRLRSLDRLPEIASAHVSETQLVSVALLIPAGRCVEVSAALDRGVSGLELRLVDVTPMSEEVPLEGAELGYGASAASARLCAVKPARERNAVIELRANVGEGAALWASQVFDPDPAGSGARAR
jgi:hypothetical protein